jgi:endonuclease YncB( thermonuclease family)
MSGARRTIMHAHIVRLLGVAACIVGIWLALVAVKHFAPASDVVRAPAPASAPVTQVPAGTSVDASIAAAPDPRRPVRDVTPGGVARVFMPPQAPAKAKPATSIRIEQAGVKPDGSIVGDDVSVRLYGVSFPEAKKICQAASGESWPCGRRAYITLHNRIAAATVNCEPRAAADPPAADCFVGGVNLATWMLGQGLARVAPDVTDEGLLAAEAGARRAKLGLWADPREGAPSTSAQRP